TPSFTLRRGRTPNVGERFQAFQKRERRYEGMSRTCQEGQPRARPSAPQAACGPPRRAAPQTFGKPWRHRAPGDGSVRWTVAPARPTAHTPAPGAPVSARKSVLVRNPVVIA